MSGLSTKSVKLNSGSGESKTIEPGLHCVKINKVSLSQPSFIAEDKGYFVVMEVETKPIEGFKGFLIDKDDESKGCYAGKIGTVQNGRYCFRDAEVNGFKYNRDMDILTFIGRICQALDCNDWFEKADGKYATIEKFVEAFDKEKPFKDKFMKMCIGGREYQNDKGYTQYGLFLAKPDKGKHAFGPINDAKLQQFNEEKHIIKSNNGGDKKVTLDPTANDDMFGEQTNMDFDFPE